MTERTGKRPGELAPEALREALAREGLTLRDGEEADVLRVARFLQDAAWRVREAGS